MEDLIHKFYTAFQNLDAESMAECYHEEIVFEDPGFGPLKGARAGNMWRMLCSSQTTATFKLEYSDVQASGNKGKAHWDAWYTFSRTGRKVHNQIDAAFEFKDGKIIKHTDTFDLHKWSRQALGPTGLLIGWTGFFKKKLQAQTNGLLTKYEKQAGLTT